MTRRKSNVAGKKEKNRKINLQGRELDLSKFSGKEGSNGWILAIAVMIGFSALVPLPPHPPPPHVFLLISAPIAWALLLMQATLKLSMLNRLSLVIFTIPPIK